MSATAIATKPAADQGSCRPVGLAEFRKALNASKVLPSIKTTLLQFAKYANTERGNSIFPGNKQIAAELDISEKTVKRHTKWARANGWMLLVHSGRGGYPALRHASIWQLSVPSKGHHQRDTSKGQIDPTTLSITTSSTPGGSDSAGGEQKALASDSSPRPRWPMDHDVNYYGLIWHVIKVTDTSWLLRPPKDQAEYGVNCKWITWDEASDLVDKRQLDILD